MDIEVDYRNSTSVAQKQKLIRHFSISAVFSGPLVLLEEFRELCRNRMTQAPILKALRSSNFHRTKSKSSRVSNPTANTSYWSFRSAILSGLGSGMISSGHLAGSESQAGPSHHSSAPTTLPPRLPRSVGLSVDGT